MAIFFSSIIFLYSFFLSCLSIVFGLLPKHLWRRGQLDRDITVSSRCRYKHVEVLFFCSSAGEYEQAKPLLNRFLIDGKSCAVCFLSVSGFSYAKKQNETCVYFLAPADTKKNWKLLFRQLRPRWTIVVRYELWPNFVRVASEHSKLVLINATMPSTASQLQRHFWAHLLTPFEKVFCVDAATKDFFLKSYQCPEEQLNVIGDTKYDRVVERALERSDLPASLESLLEYLGKSFNTESVTKDSVRNKLKLVVGSGYIQDLEFLLPVAKAYSNIDLIIAPHHVDQQNVNLFAAKLGSFGYETVRFSDISADSSFAGQIDPTVSPWTSSNNRALIVDAIGFLAELYRWADLAWVGGGCSGKVHNVLEPLAHLVPSGSGPQMHNSEEAKLAESHGVLAVCAVAEDVTKFLQNSGGSRDQIRSFLDANLGVSERLYSSIDLR